MRCFCCCCPFEKHRCLLLLESESEEFWSTGCDGHVVPRLEWVAVLFKCIRQSWVPFTSSGIVEGLLRDSSLVSCRCNMTFDKSHAVAFFHMKEPFALLSSLVWQETQQQRPVGLASKGQKEESLLLGKEEWHLFASCFYLSAWLSVM